VVMSRKAPGFTRAIRSTSSSGSARWLFYMSLGQLDSWLCYLSDVSTPSDAAWRNRRPEKRFRCKNKHYAYIEFTLLFFCMFQMWRCCTTVTWVSASACTDPWTWTCVGWNCTSHSHRSCSSHCCTCVTWSRNRASRLSLNSMRYVQ